MDQRCRGLLTSFIGGLGADADSGAVGGATGGELPADGPLGRARLIRRVGETAGSSATGLEDGGGGSDAEKGDCQGGDDLGELHLECLVCWKK
jgi:hypothetical protein